MEKNKCMTIVLCSKVIQENIKKINIKNLNKLNYKKIFIFHAGTKY